MSTRSNKKTSSGSRVRLRTAQRNQYEWRDVCLEDVVPKDHQVRAIWAYVQSLDLTPLLDQIKVTEDNVGRDTTDPAILITLWMYATIEGVGSARRLDDLTKRDWTYMWICGGVSVNYHMLNDFRVNHADFLDGVLTHSIASLMHAEVVTLKTVAQDGMRVRANAGSSSFRRKPSLKKCLAEAAARVEKLKEESESESTRQDNDRQRKAAAERAAKDRAARVAAALENLKELEAQKERREKGSGDKARCSTTDPEARNMKMGDGGFRPAYNVQFASDGETRMIAVVDVSNNGSDGGQMSPVHSEIVERYGTIPDSYVVDGGFTTIADVTKVERAGSEVIGPIPRSKETLAKGGDPHARGKKDTDEMAAFRKRMAGDGAKAKLKLRPSIAEYPNATCRNHGLHQFPVRGLAKVRAVALWHAIVHNFQRMRNLQLI